MYSYRKITHLVSDGTVEHEKIEPLAFVRSVFIIIKIHRIDTCISVVEVICCTKI